MKIAAQRLLGLAVFMRQGAPKGHGGLEGNPPGNRRSCVVPKGLPLPGRGRGTRHAVREARGSSVVTVNSANFDDSTVIKLRFTESAHREDLKIVAAGVPL